MSRYVNVDVLTGKAPNKNRNFHAYPVRIIFNAHFLFQREVLNNDDYLFKKHTNANTNHLLYITPNYDIFTVYNL